MKNLFIALLTLATITSSALAEGPPAEASALTNISVDTLAVIRADLDGGFDHGAGLGVGYEFNKFVAAHARAVAYSNEDWRGPAIDEVSLLGEATFLRSDQLGGVTLSGIGGGDYDVGRDDFGLSVGLRAKAKVFEHLSLVAEGRYRMWRKAQDDMPISLGFHIPF